MSSTDDGGGASRLAVLSAIVDVAREHLDLEDGAALERAPEELESLRLVDDLGLDSIQLLTLAVEVENRFRIALDEVDPLAVEAAGDTEVATVGELVDLVCRRLAEGGAGSPRG